LDESRDRDCRTLFLRWQHLGVRRGSEVDGNAALFSLGSTEETAARNQGQHELEAAPAQLADLETGKWSAEINVKHERYMNYILAVAAFVAFTIFVVSDAQCPADSRSVKTPLSWASNCFAASAIILSLLKSSAALTLQSASAFIFYGIGIAVFIATKAAVWVYMEDKQGNGYERS